MGFDINAKLTQTDKWVTTKSQIEALRSADVASEAAAFTANFVIEFARVRMAQIDSSLTRQLGSMKAAQTQLAALNEILPVIAEYAGGIDDAAKKERLKGAFITAASKLPEGSALRDQLMAMGNSAGSIIEVGGDNSVSDIEMNALKGKVDAFVKKIDAGQQEDQLTINMKMNARNEILQLAASLIQSMNETVKAVIGRS